MGWPGPPTWRQHEVWSAFVELYPTRLEYRVLQVAHEARYSNTTRRPGFRSTDWDLVPDTSGRERDDDESPYPWERDEKARRGDGGGRAVKAQQAAALKITGGVFLRATVTRDEAAALADMPAREAARLRRLRAEGKW